MTSTKLALADKARQFLSASTDPFHAVANAVARLEAAGFQKYKVSHSISAEQEEGRAADA